MRRLALRGFMFIAVLALLFGGTGQAVVHAKMILHGASPDPSGAPGASSLVTIDVSTGGVSVIGSFGISGIITGLAYDSDQDILFGLDGGFGGAINSLFSIDRSTGAATPVGTPHGIPNLFGLAYDPMQQLLFAMTKGNQVPNELYSLDPTTGQVTLTGANSLAQGAPFELTFDTKTNTLFLTTQPALYTVNQATGQTTLVGNYNLSTPTFGSKVRTIEYDPVLDRLLGIEGATSSTSTQRLLEIDPLTAQPTVLRSLQMGRGFLGLAFAPDTAPIPEPGTLLLIGSGLAGLGISARRRRQK